jgi:hypothetical protein
VSLGLAPVFTATTDLVVSSAPPERAGAASGISETGSELGGALGIAILGSIGVAVYRGQLAGTLPAGVPGHAAAVARDTLGGAVGVAARLPEGLGVALLDAARQAFVRGMQLTVSLSATVAVVVAVMATILLRAVPVPAQAEAGQQPAPEPAADLAAEPEVAARPKPEPQPEPAVQIIRVGSGCLAFRATDPAVPARLGTPEAPVRAALVADYTGKARSSPCYGTACGSRSGSAGTGAGTGAPPSMRSCGSHPSGLGRYQLHRPSRRMAAGTSTERTRVASISTATARPKPVCCSSTSWPAANPANTATMITAAPVMIPPVVRRPNDTASRLSSVWP